MNGEKKIHVARYALFDQDIFYVHLRDHSIALSSMMFAAVRALFLEVTVNQLEKIQI